MYQIQEREPMSLTVLSEMDQRETACEFDCAKVREIQFKTHREFDCARHYARSTQYRSLAFKLKPLKHNFFTSQQARVSK